MSLLLKNIQTILQKVPDPLGVRRATAQVVKNSLLVAIDTNNLMRFSQLLRRRIQRQQLPTSSQFGTAGASPQHVFLLDVVNFCFWAPKGQQKWAVEYPAGVISDGWTGLTAGFARALNEDIPLLDPKYLASLTRRDAQHIFRSVNGITIPLLEKRVKHLREAGKILQVKFRNSIETLLKEACYDAPTIVSRVIEHFPSFVDVAKPQNTEGARFFKRAQIFAYDISLLPTIKITNLDQLTIFADYKLPQTLRHYGVLHYHTNLARLVDTQTILPKGSRAEIEIRSATIWAGEFLAHRLKVAPAVVDNAIWSMGDSVRGILKPYHRVVTTAY